MTLHAPFTVAVAFCVCLHITAPGSFAQSAEAIEKIEKLSKDLKLTPQQKAEFLPVLQSEAPQMQAIKSNPSLTGMQKAEQLRAVHARNDPQVRSILTPQQYEKLQQIREKEIQQIIKKKLGQ
jgi:hypothetical protein